MDVITELQQQRDALKQNLNEMDTTIKKLTGREPNENRFHTPKAIRLKRTFSGLSDDKRTNRDLSNKKRWGNSVLTRSNNLDSGGEEQDEKKPAVQSSVVATGKLIESPRPVSEDNATKKRNKRMFGLLMGTLKQFKQDSQVKTEQEARREEKLTKVEEKVQKDKEDAVVERRELLQSRRGKQQELENIEFKIEMAGLNGDLKSYYNQITDVIQLRSTPRIFYKPAKHNKKTLELLQESQTSFRESLEQRFKEIDMFTETELVYNPRVVTPNKQISKEKRTKEPLIMESVCNKRDFNADDIDNDLQKEPDSVISIAETPFVENETSISLESPVKRQRMKTCIDSDMNLQNKDFKTTGYVESLKNICSDVIGEEKEACDGHVIKVEDQLNESTLGINHNVIDERMFEETDEKCIVLKDLEECNNISKENTVHQSDELFFQDEYATQLLEQVVDEGRLKKSSEVADEIEKKTATVDTT